MFEYNLLTWLVTILLVNLSLLYFAWKIYGPRINVHILKKDEKDLIFGTCIMFHALRLMLMFPRCYLQINFARKPLN